MIVLAIISIIAVSIIISLLRLLFQKINLLSFQPSDDAYYFLTYLFNEGALFLTAWLCLRFSIQNKQFLEKPTATNSKIILYGFIGAIIGLAISLTFNHLTQIVYGDLKDPILERFQSFSANYKILFAVLSSFIAPICEELLFQRALFGVFRQYDYFKSGIIFSSILFALLHFSIFAVMGVLYFVSFFIAGVILAVLYHKTSSILTSIITHVLINTTGFLLLFYWFT